MKRMVTAIVFSACLVGGVSAGTLALYTFENATEGAAVGTIVNKANPGTYDGTVATCAGTGEPTGDTPVYTNNLYGTCIFSDAMCTQVIARLPMAVRLSSTTNSYKSGAYIDFANLGTALGGKTRFTIEFFWRQHENRNESTFASLHSGIQMYCGTAWEHHGLRISGNDGKSSRIPVEYNSNWTTYLPPQGWRHWAMTYDGSGTDKIAQLYYNHQPYGAVTNGCVNGNANYPHLRFGARALAEGAASMTARGDIACIRVSDEVLGPDDFMEMGLYAYYPLKDEPSGTVMTAITNAAVAGAHDGTIGYDNAPPKFSNERPARYIFASAAKDRLLCENPGSIYFENADYWKRGDAHVAIESLGGRLLTHCCRYESGFTVELFFKKQKLGGLDYGGLRFFGIDPGLQWSIICDPSAVRYEQQDQSNSGTSYSNEGEDLKTEQWHHLAAVFRKDPSAKTNHKKLDIYVDYAKADDQTPGSMYYDPGKFANVLDLRNLIFGRTAKLGGNGFLGKFCSMRIVSRALSPEEFMVASDTLEKPSADAGFRWRFEDGSAGGNLTAAADYASGEKWAGGIVTKFGAETTQPAYSADHASERVRFGTSKVGEVTNKLSAAFAAASGTNRVFVQTRTWNGFPALHPKSWTMEAFVKPGAGARAADALIFGRGRKNPSTGTEWQDWSLVLQPDGRLGLKGRRTTDGGTADFSFADIGRSFDDGGWHRVAVSYDGDAMNLRVWSDGMCALDETLASGLVDSLKGRYLLAHGCGQGGFTGLIDEVRFNGRVLSAAEQQLAYIAGTLLLMR